MSQALRLSDILDVWQGKKSGSGYRGTCPGHGGDNEDALEITEKNGKLEYHCYTRDCSIETILRALGLWQEPTQHTNSQPKTTKKSSTARKRPPASEPKEIAEARHRAAKEIFSLLTDPQHIPNSTLEAFGQHLDHIHQLHQELVAEHGDVPQLWAVMRQDPRLAPLAAEVDRLAEPWREQLFRGKEGTPYETLGNITLALRSLKPWGTDCWYDEVRDRRMVGEVALDDPLVTKAALDLEALVRIPMRSRHLVPTALTYLCHQHPRDLLREWIEALPAWDGQPRLPSWLHTYAHAPADAYGQDVSRLLIEGPVVRALNPGCQYRYVVILEGPEDDGKSKLVRAIATPPWYQELSNDLEGKEAHILIKGAWVAELAELSSFFRTGEARLKSFFTMNEDTYVPKFSNYAVSHKRRTIFIGTVNPEGDNTYLRGQTGNTRYLPIPVRDINIEGFEAVRPQLFAEALKHYRDHVEDWWQLSSDGKTQAQEVREERRQRSVYEGKIGLWLEQNRKDITWWEQIATDCLKIDTPHWRAVQMEAAKALKALGWERQKQERIKGVGHVWPWRPGRQWLETKRYGDTR